MYEPSDEDHAWEADAAARQPLYERRTSMIRLNILAAWLIMSIGSNIELVAHDCLCDGSEREYCVNGYYVHWLSRSVVASKPDDVIRSAKFLCCTVGFRLAHDQEAGRLIDSVVVASKARTREADDSVRIDCKLVFIVQRDRRRDTLSFGNSSFMYVNKLKVPVCIPLMRALVQRLPYWQAEIILKEALLAGSK